ncbi:ERCC4-like helicase [Metarhizium robertsii]|uniref:ATP-dependent DNA helicase n=2 Tax=Metarhizium robertsii TaxID=568076 RepID=E9EVX0_METRA|nr:helicase C-terminal domain protein [Metarhizium robertsii ARSEF 23]EFZ00392.1 helicase C-terminal domain protein [Metarhizium robertsii ARSEF 23]EXV02867.1 ERCC4-like helicase [Metarhizium robertsii]
MDDDEFGEDFVDEDFLEALDQVSSSNRARPVSQPSSNEAQFENKTWTKSNPLAAAAQELEDLPSDAFSSPEPEKSASVAAAPTSRKASNGPRVQNGLTRTASGNFRQTTLWGTEVREDAPFRTQAPIQRVFRADVPHEEPSHHELDRKEMETWVYPTNLGAIRDYQFSIVKNSLFNNTLVALPTGLGKTFIAATVMLNFYRWTKSAKIVFVAPTKPLAAQQIDACYNIVGIPRSHTTLLTGDIQPALRAEEWEKRRVFFMTPQTLLNDLSHGYAEPKSIALLVIDEAHRAVGEYAYAKVTKLIRRFSKSFRVLALTATPGSKIETVQEVIDNLGISHCEIRTEESIDIRQYVHERNIEKMVLDPSDEMNLVSELFTEALKPLVDKLGSQNIYYGRNPMAMSTYGLMQVQKEWFATRGRHANQGVQFMMRAIFSVLTSLAHSIKLLNFHGIKPFYDNMKDFRSEQEGKGEKGSKYKRQLIEHSSFQKMMDHISRWLRTDGFVGHPKLAALVDCVLNHFMDQGEGSTTRVIVFSEYRDSAEDIVCQLNKHQPLLKASVFVGQADGKRGEGMKQAQQIQTIEKFRKGEFNVLVATSIGEEGLDIGQVDLIVCYDSSASPIRMLQRMGRTGRKRAGNIVLLLMRGKEEDQFAKSKDSYESMQKLICEGSRFNFRFDLSMRIVPREIRPEVDKKFVEIPVENTQDPSLPEPKKRRPAAGKKKPPKKFHMPDGVETGFQKLSYYMKSGPKPEQSKPKQNPELNDLESIPDLSSVVLTEEELKELDRSYRDLPFNHSVVEETDMPSMTAYPLFQRQLRPVANLKHGTCTRRFVKLLAKMGTEPESLVRQCRSTDTSRFKDITVRAFIASDGEPDVDDTSDSGTKKRSTRQRSVEADNEESQPPRGKRKKISTTSIAGLSELEDDSETPGMNSRARKRTKKPKSKRKGRKTKQRTGINSDELGDDCERDSDLIENGGSDDGADLLDFVVADNQGTSSMVGSQVTSPTTASAQSTPKAESKQPFYVPTRFSATQESDDMPDVDTLVKRKAFQKVISMDASDSDLEDLAAKRPARGRRQVFDSDSDA